MKKLPKWIRKHANNIARIFIISLFLILAIWAITIEYNELVDGELGFLNWLKIALVSIGPELAGIVIGVVTIDFLNEMRQDSRLKKQLILQMGSRNKDVTDTAIRTLRSYPWLCDGSIKGAVLIEANLENSRLHEANLQEVNLLLAKLKFARLYKADLTNAQLVGADLKQAILTKAVLDGANLEGADLNQTKLSGTSLVGANLRRVRNFEINQLLQAANLDGAIMPDGRKYEEWKLDVENSQF